MVLRQDFGELNRAAQDKIFLEKSLTSSEAQKRLEKHGPNELVRKKEFSTLKLFFSQFKSPLIYILVFAGLVTLFLREFTDSIVIFAAVFLNTLLGFYQEFKAQKSLVALRSLLTSKARVIRDGEQKIINARCVVPGDLLVLTIGDQVPADGVLVEGTDLTVNEAILTGESVPVAKKANSKDCVFLGTTVVTGIGKMVVTKTGMETEMGKIGKIVGEVEEEKTPLQIQLEKLARILAIVVGVITILIFLLGEVRGYGPLEMFTTSVAVAVAAIPEGLVITLTVILSLGMQRILKQQAIVRKLLAGETLGSVSCICCDKTGTLTEGKLRVVRADTPDEDLLTKAAILCNDMRDPLEEAMLRWVEEKLSNEEIKKLRENYQRLDEIPFSPKTKIIATLHRVGSGQALLFVSGAPEIVISKCQMSNVKCQMWEEKFKKYGEQGYRLVGFAYQVIPDRKFKPIRDRSWRDLEWLGILVYEDPVREGVKEALEECRQAGIKVKVITGDYLPTALSVLEKLGLDGREDALTGEELEKISAEELRKKVGGIVLFARTDPQQKLKIVQALKENNEVVAMMGDGVNDAPALKAADIGIVVGEASDVAKETADIVLLDSNFSTIIHAIEEGRNIFENIKKVILYLLANSFMEVILVSGSILLKMPLPVTAAQILWVNLVADTLPAIALTFEPKEKELMELPPRSAEAPILDFQLKFLICIIGVPLSLGLLVLAFWLNKSSIFLHEAQTIVFVALGINSLFVCYACRSLRKPIFRYNPFANQTLSLAILIGWFLLVMAVYWPPLQRLLNTYPLTMIEWLFLLSLGFLSLLTIEIFKWLFASHDKLR